MNFDCIFSNCNYKQNDVEESEFLKHLKKEHHDEIIETAEKENMAIEMIEMMAISNSKIFINS